MRRKVLILAAGAAIFTAADALAVITYGSPGRNTSAPTGALANAGWQYEGSFGTFQGTPIAPNYFISAEHIGGGIGQTFTYQGQDYTTTAVYDSPNTDLRIWRVNTPFSSYAPLYNSALDGAPDGRNLFVTGRGVFRGDPIYMPLNPNGAGGGSAAAMLPDSPNSGDSTQRLAGWYFTGGETSPSWGTNVVTSVVNGGSTLGNLLYFTFDTDGGDNEAALGFGDSGGGVYVETSSGYKLAGINFGINGPVRLTYNGNAFYGAIFDIRGMYYGDNQDYFPVTGPVVSLGAYASSISDNLAWIQSVTGPIPAALVPEPTSGVMLGAILIGLRRRSRKSPRAEN